MEFDEGGVFYSDQQLERAQQDDIESPAVTRIKYREFVRTYRHGEVFIYRERLRETVSLGRKMLEVDLDDVMRWDDALGDDLLLRPGFHLPLFEAAAVEAAISMAFVEEDADEKPSFQITLTSTKAPTTIRQLLSSQVSRVVMIPGIVIAASRVKAKATTVYAQCKGCQAFKQIAVRGGFAGAMLPKKCDEPRQPGEAKCPLDPYSIVPEKCKCAARVPGVGRASLLAPAPLLC